MKSTGTSGAIRSSLSASSGPTQVRHDYVGEHQLDRRLAGLKHIERGHTVCGCHYAIARLREGATNELHHLGFVFNYENRFVTTLNQVGLGFRLTELELAYAGARMRMAVPSPACVSTSIEPPRAHHDPVDRGQSQAGPSTHRFRRKEGFEDALTDLWSHPDTIIRGLRAPFPGLLLPHHDPMLRS